MRKPINANDLYLSTSKSVYVQFPIICPCCSIGIEAKHLYSAIMPITEKSSGSHMFSMFRCPHCESAIMVDYALDKSNDIGYEMIHYPFDSNPVIIPEQIASISPEFQRIFNEAHRAETNGLSLICGMGYRKALEFLIKDYAIYRHPDDVEGVKSKPLSQCISDYIDSSKIRELAKASAWLGNDETHYERKHPEYDLQNLKAFINALIHFIESELLVDSAHELLSKGK